MRCACVTEELHGDSDWAFIIGFRAAHHALSGMPYQASATIVMQRFKVLAMWCEVSRVGLHLGLRNDGCDLEC